MALLRCLTGTSVAELARQLLDARQLPTPARLGLLELLATQRPRLAAAVVWKRFSELTNAGRDATAVFELLERSRAVEAGTGREWLALRAACWKADPCEFVTHFVGVWQRKRSHLPGSRLLAACAEALKHDELPHDGARAAELVTDLSPGVESSEPTFLTPLGDVVLLQACAPDSGCELWRTDGTTLSQVADIAPVAASSSPSGIVRVGGSVVFNACDATAGCELWRSDGVVAARAADIDPGPGGSFPQNFVQAGDVAFFLVFDGVNGQ